MPTRASSSPSAQTISVADGSSETMRSASLLIKVTIFLSSFFPNIARQVCAEASHLSRIYHAVVSGQWPVVRRNQRFTDRRPLTTDHCSLLQLLRLSRASGQKYEE